MSNQSPKNMTQKENLSVEAQNIIFKFFDRLRNENIFKDANGILMVSLYGLMPDADKKVLELLDKYTISLDRYLSTIEIDCLKAEYPAVVSYCMKNSDIKADGYYYTSNGIIHLPSSLVDLCMSLANSLDGKSVYLPFSGDGSIGIDCVGCSISGFEMNPTAWAFSQIAIKSKNPSAHIELKNWRDIADEKKYDYIFTFPPILDGENKRSLIQYVLKTIRQQLNDGGEFYAILPSSFCNDTSGWFDVRKTICWDSHQNFSVMVIALPSNVIPYTAAQFCLVKFAKNHNNEVTLIDVSGKEFYAIRDFAGTKGHTLKVQSILETIQTKDEKHVWIGKLDDIAGDVCLTPERYLLENKLLQYGHKDDFETLSELIEIIPTDQDNEDSNSSKNPPLVGMRELCSNYLNCDISIEDIPLSDRPIRQTINCDCLLVGFIGGKFKVGRTHGVSPENPIALRHEVRAFKIISDKVTEDFLLNSLLLELTEIQAKVYASGATISRLSTPDLLAIKILVPQKNEQDRICKEATRKSLTESDRKLLESYEEFRADTHMKKHAIGQDVFELLGLWNNLMNLSKNNDGTITSAMKYGTMTVPEIEENIDSLIDIIREEIDSFTIEDDLKSDDKILIKDFLSEFIKKNKRPNFIFMDLDIPEELNDLVFDFSIPALKHILRNLIFNACSYGFVNLPFERNRIQIGIAAEEDYISLNVSNNGAPIDPKIKDKVFQYGWSSNRGKENHRGLGCYQVKALMKEAGGDAELVLDPESEYPVTFKLIFRNYKINNESNGENEE